ncbi:MAG: hypothetical protein AAF585_00370 [Verrucomicrobiota bacterium]
MKIVFYAINGIGLGHLSRCEAIARRVRSFAEMLGETVDIQFLTTSDADWVVQDFPVYKFPSKSVFAGQKGAAKRYASGAKLMISNMLAWMRPDVLVVDTQSQGAFAEFHFLREYARQTVLIERHKLVEQAESSVHQTHLKLYDRVLIPDDHSQRDRYVFPAEIEPMFVGRICGYDDNRTWSASQVREHFGVGPDQHLVYVAAGGGGDPAAAEELREMVERVAGVPNVVVLAAFGPLAKQDAFYSTNGVISVREAQIWRYFPGLDLAISAAGYNSYEELLAAGVPTLFYAQAKGLDDQEGRITIGEDAGWHGRLDRDRVAEQVTEVLAGEVVVDGNLDARQNAKGSINAASQILELGMGDSPLEAKLTLNAAALAIERGAESGFREWLNWERRSTSKAALADRLMQLWEADETPSWFVEALDWGTPIAAWRDDLERPNEVDIIAVRLRNRFGDDATALFQDVAEIVMGGIEMSEILEVTADPDLDFQDWIDAHKPKPEDTP